jgi:uncharacterized OsmC-like protein
MPEKVIVRQNKDFAIGYWANDPQEPDSQELQPITSVFELSPYTMMLASLGACSTIVVHTYAQNHAVDLEEVEISLEYLREAKESSDGMEKYEERIVQQVAFRGELDSQELDKLHIVAQNCSLHHMMDHGIEIQSELLEKEPEPLEASG